LSFRTPINTIAALALALIIVAVPAFGGTAGNKADMLSQLTKTVRSRMPARAAEVTAEAPKEAAQLALDLVFYNWASRVQRTTSDIRNCDTIIPALAKELKDSTVDWAILYFSTTASPSPDAQVPSRDDERVQDLFDLKTQFRSALDYRESSPIKAVDALQNALRLCQKLSLDLSEALILKRLGDHYFHDMSRYLPAETCYERAWWTFSSYRCAAAAATVNNDRGELNKETGRYADAAESFTGAARLWEQLAKDDPSRFKYRDLAGLGYIKAADAQIAAGNPSAALELMRTKGLGQLQIWAMATRSYEPLIVNLIKVSDFQRGLGNNAESLDLLRQAQGYCERLMNPLLTARVLDELGKTYAAMNQPANKAAAATKRAKTLKEAAAAGEAALVALAKKPAPKSVSALRLAAERGAEAYRELAYYPKSSDLWERIVEMYTKVGDVDAQIRCLRALAAVADAQQKPLEALVTKVQAAMVARQANQTALAAEIVRDLTRSLIEAKDLQNALEGFAEFATIAEEAGDIRGVAQVLRMRGSMLATGGQFEDAITDLQKARMRYMSQVGDLWAAGQVSLDLAAAQNSAGKPDAALVTLETVINEIETKYGLESYGPSNGSDRAGIVKNLYRELARVYVHSGNPGAATELIRKGKRYPWLSQLVAEMRGDAGDPDSAKWAKEIDVNATDGVLPLPNEPGDRLLGSDWAGFAQSCWLLERQYPRDYAALCIDPLDLLKRRNLIPDGVVAVEFMPTESALYVFVCGKDTSICRQTSAKRGAIDGLVGKLRRALKNCEESLSAGIPIPPVADWQESSFLEIREPLVGLYSQLMQPIKVDIGDRRKIAFVLPAEFAGLPLHALISSEGGARPTFLIEDFEVSYVGRGMLDDLAGDTNRAIDPGSDWLAIFADPEQNLPGARKEAAEIASAYVNNRSYVGRDQATATSFLIECQKAGIIHLAAHHRVDANPTGFQLLLAPDSKSDGTIGVREMAGVNNPYLQLVVMSACDSIGSADPISSGPEHAAEVFSLAGASSIVGGLWKVSDDAASKVMVDFYRGLSRGTSRAEALQRAQVSVIESRQFAHPFYWACFALFGNPR